MANDVLTTKLIADATGFVKGVDKAEGSLKKFSSSAGALLGAAGIAGAAKLALGAFTDMAERMDAVGKAADRLGIASEALTGLQHAAEQAGSSAAALEKGIIALQKNVTEAAGGSKTLTKAFDELGISAKDLAALDTERQFDVMADALSGVEDVTKRNAIAFKIMGRAGIELSATLAMGSEGLAEMKQEAIDMGIALDRDAIAQLEAFNDSVDRLQKRVRGAMQSILVTFTPVMNGFTAFAEHAIKSYAAVGISGEDMAQGMVEVAAFVLGTIDRFTRVMISGLDIAIKATMVAVAESINFVVRQAFKLFNALPDRVQSWMGIGDPPTIDTAGWINDIKFAAGEMDKAFFGAGDLGDVLREGSTAGLGAAPAIPGIPSAEVAAEAAKETGKAAGKAVLEGINDAINESPELSPFERWVEKQEGFLRSLEGVAVQTMQNMSVSIGNTFASAIVDAESFSEAVERSIKALLASLISAVIQTVIQTAIAAAASQAMWKGPAILASTATLGAASGIGKSAVAASLAGTGGGIGGGGGGGGLASVTVNNNVGADIGISQSAGGLSVSVDSARDAVAQDFADSLSAGSGVYADAIQRFGR